MGDQLEGQLVNNSQQMGIASIPEFINHYKGASATLIEDPRDADLGTDQFASHYMMISVEAGSFRMQVGDTTATIGAFAVPSATITDGTGTFPLEEFEVYVFTSPNKFTIVGNSANAVMTVAWL